MKNLARQRFYHQRRVRLPHHYASTDAGQGASGGTGKPFRAPWDKGITTTVLPSAPFYVKNIKEMMNIRIREAEIEDSQIIFKFIKDLAAYEKAEHEMTAEVRDIQESIFGKDSTVKALICCKEDVPIGYAVYFYNYSTWQGRKGLYLEDLYIMPEHQGDGAGYQLLRYLAKKAVAENCGRFEWSVLEWNEPAIKFYQSIGAKPKSEWVGYQLAGEALMQFAKG